MEHPEDASFPTEHIDIDLIQKTLEQFRGEILQIPPVYSAVKVNGKRAFDYARKGDQVELKAKPLVIDEIEVIKFDMPWLTLRVVCSKGTYIRALARDIGKSLDSGAYLTALRRTRVGDVSVADCITIEEFEQTLEEKATKSIDSSN